MQSQDYLGATWALGQRLRGWTRSDIDRAFDDGAFVRTHVLRPTWHFVAPEDLRWLVALSGPRLRRGAGHRHRALEIDAELATRSIGIFERALGRAGALTRQQLRGALAEEGIVAAAGRLAHLVMVAEYEGVLCSGPRRGTEQTYALVDERIPPSAPRERDAALAELAVRYVGGHGPIQDVDLAWWAGLSLGDARRGLAAAGKRVERTALDDGRAFWSADDGRTALRPTTTRGHLLPNYDELLVALRDRRDGLHPDLPPDATTPQSILADVVAVDGLVVGRWERPVSTGGLELRLRPRIELADAARRAVAAAVRRYGTFLGRPLTADWPD